MTKKLEGTKKTMTGQLYGPKECTDLTTQYYSQKGDN